MKTKPTNIAASVRDRLLNQAREAKTDVQLLATRYVLERLLYRLSLSPYKHQFVLKGAMLFPAWGAEIFRPTRDLDLLGFGETAPEVLAQTFRDVFHQDVEDDGLVFDAESVSARPIRGANLFGGVRIKSIAQIGTARYPVQVDIGFGDLITPKPDEIDYPTLLDFPAPRLLAYPPVTVVAEKFEAMIQIGIASTRIKDFYDLAAMPCLFDFDGQILVEAIRNTFGRRQTEIPLVRPAALTAEFADKPESRRLWRRFSEEDVMLGKETDFNVILDQIAEFVLPPGVAAASNESFDCHWPAGGPWSNLR